MFSNACNVWREYIQVSLYLSERCCKVSIQIFFLSSSLLASIVFHSNLREIQSCSKRE
nr:MAG TPA: hypothetical protein [Caudoviricetes sp.]